VIISLNIFKRFLFEFNVHGTVYRKMYILYNQRDATYTMFFIIISALHVSGGLEQPIHTSGRQQESMTIPKAAHSGFGGLGVSALAFGIQVSGFKPGRSRRIFQDEKILSAPSFGREV
jgi:hypothetical protein